MKWLILSISVFSFTAQAAIPSKNVIAGSKGKYNRYVKEGVVRAGDAMSSPKQIDDVRFGKQLGYERIVIDISEEGGSASKGVPPYYQLAVNANTATIELGIHKIAKLKASSAKIRNAIASSDLIGNVYIAPLLDNQLASLHFDTAQAVEVESFYLVNPPRIILDIRARQ